MALPKEPRQKMINLMYLVLTALLAMNVSAEIINAFRTVNESLMTANGVVTDKNNIVYKNFDDKIKDPKTQQKAEYWKPKADQAKKLSDDMYNYIESLKNEIIAGSKSDPKDTTYKEDDLNAPSRILVESPKGKDLYAKLTAYKKGMLDIIDPAKYGDQAKEIQEDIKSAFQSFEKNLPLNLAVPKSNNEGNSTWEAAYFRMTPSVAAITILSKFQNDVKNSESQMVDYLFKKVGEVVVVYDQFEAIASQNSNYLMPGDELVITAGVGAFSKAAKPTVSIDGAGVPLNAQGAAEYKTKVGGAGPQTKKVRVSFVKPDGTTGTVEKEVKYTVGTPGALAVSTDKTRVFYAGLDNPVTLRGAGGSEALSLSKVSGPISVRSAGGGQFIVNATAPGSAVLSATDGKTTQQVTIPVKRIPSPIPKIGGSSGGVMAAGTFRAQRGVAADLQDFVFEGVTFQVVAFTVVFSGKGFEEEGVVPVDCQGAYFNAQANAAKARCQAGSSVQFSDIKVKGPDGVRDLEPTIALLLQ